MRKRFLLAATTLAAVVPTLAVAQARPAQPTQRPATPPAQQPRPAAPPAQRPAAAPATRPATSMATAHREGTLEFSAGVGAAYGAKFYGSTVGFLGLARLGYNLNQHVGISAGAGVGSINSATFIQPFGAVTYTADINQKMSPFVTVGAGITTMGSGVNKNTSDYDLHGGVGIRNMMNDNMALRVEARAVMSAYKVGAPGSQTTNNTAMAQGLVGLSWFFGGKKVVTHIAVAPATTNLVSAGATQRFTATVHDQRGREMAGRTATWSSSNPSVATVNAQGMVTAVNDGSADITATVEGVRGSARVTVARAVNSVTVTPTTGAVNALGRTQQFTAAGKDANNQPMTNAQFTWASSNPAVATVSNTGMATAVGTGTANITATANGKSASATLTVTQAVASVAVTPATPNISAGATTQLAAAASDANQRPVAGKTFTWTSDAPTIATVSTTGLVTGLAAGTAHISAAVDNQTGAATVTVTAVAAPPRVGEGVWEELQTSGRSRVVSGVNFVGRTSRLAPSSNASLDGLASMIKQVLQTNANAKFEISGHTDNTGVAATNQRNSTARARSVVTYLTTHGVPAAALTAVGYGGTQPKWPNNTAANRRQNNRIEIKRTN